MKTFRGTVSTAGELRASTLGLASLGLQTRVSVAAVANRVCQYSRAMPENPDWSLEMDFQRRFVMRMIIKAHDVQGNRGTS